MQFRARETAVSVPRLALALLPVVLILGQLLLLHMQNIAEQQALAAKRATAARKHQDVQSAISTLSTVIDRSKEAAAAPDKQDEPPAADADESTKTAPDILENQSEVPVAPDFHHLQRDPVSVDDLTSQHFFAPEQANPEPTVERSPDLLQPEISQPPS
jgi:hypothetical protein